MWSPICKSIEICKDVPIDKPIEFVYRGYNCHLELDLDFDKNGKQRFCVWARVVFHDSYQFAIKERNYIRAYKKVKRLINKRIKGERKCLHC